MYLRIQSDDLKALAVVLETILARIDKLKKPSKEQKQKQAKSSVAPAKIKIIIQPVLQPDQILALVMDHHKARQEVQDIRVGSRRRTTSSELNQNNSILERPAIKHNPDEITAKAFICKA